MRTFSAVYTVFAQMLFLAVLARAGLWSLVTIPAWVIVLVSVSWAVDGRRLTDVDDDASGGGDGGKDGGA